MTCPGKYALIVVIPCFNEAKRLSAATWLPYIEAQPDFHFVFINDGSTDNTPTFLEGVKKQCPNVSILTLGQNVGKGEAVRAGMQHAINSFEFDLIGFIDADLSTPLTELNRFTRILHQQGSLDMAIGSRVQMLGKKIHRNLFRHYLSRVIATFICKILNEPVYDTQCGLKVFRFETARVLTQDVFISKWLFDVELLARYKVLYGSGSFNEKIIEVPLNEWTEKENSKLRFYYFPVIASDLLKIRKKYFVSKKP